ncbi:MAG: hypothetical protein C0490_15730 [Marivirga sp.]|nr:hypothetical protein [Marivirga sp.]
MLDAPGRKAHFNMGRVYRESIVPSANISGWDLIRRRPLPSVFMKTLICQLPAEKRDFGFVNFYRLVSLLFDQKRLNAFI